MFLGGGLIQKYSKIVSFVGWSQRTLNFGCNFPRKRWLSADGLPWRPEVVDLGLFLSLAPHATSTTGATSGGCMPGSTRRLHRQIQPGGGGSTTK